MEKNFNPIINSYQNRIEEANQDIALHKSLSNRFALVRLAIFLLAIPILYFLIKTTIVVFILSFVLIFSTFLWAVIKQMKYDKLLNEAKARKAINVNEISAITNHENLYFDGASYQIHNHAYTEDLDIFGPHSLFGLINRSRTYFGNQILRSLFLNESTKDEILLRQEAVDELKDNVEWRQELAVKLFELEELHDYNVAEAIEKQMSIDMSFADKALVKYYRKVLPLLWILIFGLYFFNTSLANTLFTIVFIGNLVLTGNYTKRISKIQGKLSHASTSLKKYISALQTVFQPRWKSALLKDTSSRFTESNSEMSVKSLGELSGLINKLDYRLNFLVAIVANGFVLWDLKIISRLNQWKSSNDGEIEKIFYHIGFMECLSSLATWAFNHPFYDYPSIHNKYLKIEAEEIEHPLIHHNQNVANDFVLTPSDKVSIITGSNMSGKSTFLRTLAINMILAYTGTKTASSKLSIPIVKTITYMRIKDALEENVSTFKAELNRIRMILDVLKRDKNAFIFIDEMLRGTNSKDKLNGSMGITKKLLASDAYAIIATHDIKLAEMGEKDDNIANYFFDIDYKDGDLVFDYKLKQGICENFNASFLLGQLGIDTENH